MKNYKPERYWSKFAGTLNEDQRYIAGEASQRVRVDRLSQETGLGEAIEFGCGAGFYTKVLAGNAGRVLATDLSDEMLAVAETELKDLPNVTIEKADCESLGYPDNRFDTVFMANVIQGVKDPLTALRESHRVLKNGGLLLIISGTLHGMKRWEKIKMSLRFFRKWGKPPGYFRGSLSPDDLSVLVEEVGFQVEEVQLIGDRIKALFLKARKRQDNG